MDVAKHESTKCPVGSYPGVKMEGPSHQGPAVPPTVSASTSTGDLAALVASHVPDSGASSTWSDEVSLTPALPLNLEAKPHAQSHQPTPHEHHGISGAFRHIAHTVHDLIHRHTGQKGTFIVFHLPHATENSANPGPSPNPSPDPSQAASHNAAVFTSAIHPSASNASLNSVSSSVVDVSSPSDSNIVLVKLPHRHHLSTDSIRSAMHEVSERLHHIHLPHLHPGDWFKRKHRDLNAMATPAGSNTAPVGSIINLLNGTLGAGILAMPLMFSLMGWLLATIVLALTGVAGVISTYAMTAVGYSQGTESYHMTIQKCLGKRFALVYELLLIAGNTGSLIAYLILIADFATAAVTNLLPGYLVNRRVLLMIIAIFFVFPLTLLRKVKSLWFTGFMAMTFVAFYVVTMMYEASKVPSHHPQFMLLDTTVGRFFQGLPICFFSYSCHNSVFPVYHEMAHRTPHVFKKVTIANHVIAGLLYFVSGMTGYWIFGTNLGGNVLKQFSGANPDDVISLVTIGFLFTIVFVFPMVNFSLRICIHHLLHGETDTTRLQHVMETIVPFVVALAAALFVTDLGVVYGLIGSIGACSFALLFPALLYLRSVTMKDKSARMVWSCRVLFAVGVLMMVMGVLSSLGVKM